MYACRIDGKMIFVSYGSPALWDVLLVLHAYHTPLYVYKNSKGINQHKNLITVLVTDHGDI